MDAGPSLTRQRQDSFRKSVQLGKGRLWCCAFLQQGRLTRLLWEIEPQSPLRLLVCSSPSRRFPELNHVSTTTNLTMMSEENQGLALFQANFSTVLQYTVTPRSPLQT